MIAKVNICYTQKTCGERRYLDMKTFLMSIALFVLFLSTIYVLFTFMILEFGINDALTLIDIEVCLIML